jgi:hypothetical protein
VRAHVVVVVVVVVVCVCVCVRVCVTRPQRHRVSDAECQQVDELKQGRALVRSVRWW